MSRERNRRTVARPDPGSGRAAQTLGAVLALLLAACGGVRSGGTGAATAAGPVPAAVAEHGVILLHGGLPEQATISASEGGDYEMTSAARANGVEAAYTVRWSGIERTKDGRAEDVRGSFTALKLASDGWQLFAGTGDVLNTLCTGAGAFSTKGDDYAGVYVGATDRGDYRNVRLELRRSGPTHVGTLRYVNPWGETQTFRVLGFHRIAAEDAAVGHMDGRFEFWAQEEGVIHRHPVAAPAGTVEVRGTAIMFGWLPPQQNAAGTLRREGG